MAVGDYASYLGGVSGQNQAMLSGLGSSALQGYAQREIAKKMRQPQSGGGSFLDRLPDAISGIAGALGRSGVFRAGDDLRKAGDIWSRPMPFSPGEAYGGGLDLYKSVNPW